MFLLKKKSSKSLGVSFSIAEVIFTITIASIVKFISSELSVFMILFFRYLFCIPILLFTAFYERKFEAFQITSKSGLILRTITGLGSFGCLFGALQFIDLSLMTIILQTMPLFVTFLAPIIIKEVVGWYRKIIALVGFIGVILILNPFSEEWKNFGIILGVLSPFFGALMTIYVRKLGITDHPTSTALWYNIFGAVVFTIYCSSFLSFEAISKNTWLILLVIGILASAQQIFMASSHKYASASGLAPIHYANIPIGVFIGILVFNETIDVNFITGTVLIICSTLFIIYREKTLNKD